jgi:hypothetical protein
MPAAMLKKAKYFLLDAPYAACEKDTLGHPVGLFLPKNANTVAIGGVFGITEVNDCSKQGVQSDTNAMKMSNDTMLICRLPFFTNAKASFPMNLFSAHRRLGPRQRMLKEPHSGEYWSSPPVPMCLFVFATYGQASGQARPKLAQETIASFKIANATGGLFG